MTEETGFEPEYVDLPEAIEISESLEKLVDCAFEEARTKLIETGECIPFTVLLSGENLYFETHPGDDPAECRESAAHTVKTAGDEVESYAFCYDGYVDLDEGECDALIVEASEAGDEEPLVFCLLYQYPDEENEDQEPLFDEDWALLVADAESLF